MRQVVTAPAVPSSPSLGLLGHASRAKVTVSTAGEAAFEDQNNAMGMMFPAPDRSEYRGAVGLVRTGIYATTGLPERFRFLRGLASAGHKGRQRVRTL